MKPPRRIFRGSSRRLPFGRNVLFATAGVACAAGLGLTALSSDLLGNTPPPPSHVEADAHNVAVIDGDTLRLEGHVVRLRGVEAPDRGDKCRGDMDCGGAATTALAGLVRGRRVECALADNNANGRLADHDANGRPYASCRANGTDLSRAIIASGWARAQPGAPELADLELRARRQRAGLWADIAVH